MGKCYRSEFSLLCPENWFIKHWPAHNWIEDVCDKYQTNDQATSAREGEKEKKSHWIGVDKVDFMKEVGAVMNQNDW
jgi:hypothetical protein